MPRRWLFLPIDPGKTKFMTFIMLFHRGSAAAVYDVYLAAEKGDPSGLALLSMMYDFIWPAMNIWGEWANKADPDMDRARNWAAEMDPPGTILTSPSIVYGLGKAWPEAPIPAEFTHMQPSAVTTLLVNGNIDYSTPPQSIEKVLPTLSNGQHVILSEFGHTGDFWKYQPEARLHLLTTFYDTGKADDSRYIYQPMKFSVGIKGSFPILAKLIVAVPVLLVIILGALTWFIVRRVRRRRTRRFTN